MRFYIINNTKRIQWTCIFRGSDKVPTRHYRVDLDVALLAKTVDRNVHFSLSFAKSFGFFFSIFYLSRGEGF